MLVNLTPAGREHFRLPATALPLTLFRGRRHRLRDQRPPRHPPPRPREPPPLAGLAHLLAHPPHHPRLQRGLGRPPDRADAPRPPRGPHLHPRRQRRAARRGGRMTLELDIVSIGMVTAVGLDAPSACAAMRARLDGFQETRFLGPGGDWLVGAPVPLPRNFIGEKRLAHMAAAAILEAIDDRPRRPRHRRPHPLPRRGRPPRPPRPRRRRASPPASPRSPASPPPTAPASSPTAAPPATSPSTRPAACSPTAPAPT